MTDTRVASLGTNTAGLPPKPSPSPKPARHDVLKAATSQPVLASSSSSDRSNDIPAKDDDASKPNKAKSNPEAVRDYKAIVEAAGDLKISGVIFSDFQATINETKQEIAAELAERPSRIYANVWVPLAKRKKTSRRKGKSFLAVK